MTLVDGARELRRALDAGVEVVEAFVCEPLLAGEDARAALDALRGRGIPVTTTTEAAFAKLAFGDRAEGLRGRHPGAVARPRRPARCRRPAASSSSRTSRSPATSAPSCARADGAGRRRGHRRLAADGPRQSERHPGQRRARSSRSRWRRPRPRDVLAWLPSAASASSPPGSTATRPYTDADLTGAVAIVARAARRKAWASLARRRHRGRSTCRCAASPTASTSRSPRPSCCTRRDGNATVTTGRAD